jgi:GPH family glycoside/pentoside/hexuronide:cation symporter
VVSAERSTAAPRFPVLPGGVLFAYAAPGFGVSFLYSLLLVMYLKFATDRLGASAAIVGFIVFASKVWDAVSDPLAGNLSDRTRSRLGRRRSWLLASALPIAFFSWMAWAPPAALGRDALHAWIAVAIFGFYTAFTIFEVPHMALGAELSPGGTERNRIFGARQLVRTVGLGVAFTVGVAVLADPERARANAVALALVVGGFTAVSIAWGVWRLPAERADYMGRGGGSLVLSLRDVWGNRHARLLLFVFFIETLGLGGIGVLTPFVIEYVMKTPHLVPYMLALYMGASLLGIPIWVRLARRFEKRRLWLFAMVQGGVGFGLLFWVGEGDWPLMAASSLIAGTANACGATLGQSLKADVVDVDEHRTGERKEGAYFAAWSFVSKLSGGVMIGVVGVVLERVGYVPNAEQSEAVKAAMVFLMGGLPMIGYAIGSLAFLRFDLSQAEHARIRRELDARAAQPHA